MKLSDLDTKKMEFTEEEMDGLVEILVKAEEIKADPSLYKAVQKHAKKKVKSIKSVSDLRAKAAELEMAPEPMKGA